MEKLFLFVDIKNKEMKVWNLLERNRLYTKGYKVL